jgi:hypothetical protein
MRRPACRNKAGGRRSFAANRKGRRGYSLLLLLALLTACVRVPLPTLPGPEASDLLPRLQGVLVLDARRALEIVELPSMKTRVLALDTYFWGGDRFTAPDEHGRIAVITAAVTGASDEVLLGRRKHRLPVARYVVGTIRLDGTERHNLQVFESAELHAVGPDVALSRSGDTIAYARNSKVERIKMRRGFLGLFVGELHLVSTVNGAETVLEARPVGSIETGDRALVWHPDGRRLAYVALAPHGEGMGAATASGDFGREFVDEAWEKVPVVHLLDVASGQDRALHLGFDPLISEDGATLALRDLGQRWLQIDLASGIARPLQLPGNWAGPLALLRDGLVIYWGLPMEGAPARFTEHYSPLMGPTPLGTLKIADLSTGRFQTIFAAVEGRWRQRFRFSPAP